MLSSSVSASSSSLGSFFPPCSLPSTSLTILSATSAAVVSLSQPASIPTSITASATVHNASSLASPTIPAPNSPRTPNLGELPLASSGTSPSTLGLPKRQVVIRKRSPWNVFVSARKKGKLMPGGDESSVQHSSSAAPRHHLAQLSKEAAAEWRVLSPNARQQYTSEVRSATIQVHGHSRAAKLRDARARFQRLLSTLYSDWGISGVCLLCLQSKRSSIEFIGDASTGLHQLYFCSTWRDQFYLATQEQLDELGGSTSTSELFHPSTTPSISGTLPSSSSSKSSGAALPSSCTNGISSSNGLFGLLFHRGFANHIH